MGLHNIYNHCRRLKNLKGRIGEMLGMHNCIGIDMYLYMHQRGLYMQIWYLCGITGCSCKWSGSEIIVPL